MKLHAITVMELLYWEFINNSSHHNLHNETHAITVMELLYWEFINDSSHHNLHDETACYHCHDIAAQGIY